MVSQGSCIAVGPNGNVYVVWQLGYTKATSIGFVKSTDGGQNFTNPISIASVTQIGTLNNDDGMYALKVTQNNPAGIRINCYPSIAVDPNNGTIYVVWADSRNGDPDIYFISGTTDLNGNITWSNPKRINNDQVGNGKDQWFPWINVASDGTINVVFYDSRNDPANLSAMVYIARSVDGGSSFVNYQISDAAFTPVPIQNANSGYMGDYIGMASTTTDAYPCWMDK